MAPIILNGYSGCTDKALRSGPRRQHHCFVLNSKYRMNPRLDYGLNFTERL